MKNWSVVDGKWNGEENNGNDVVVESKLIIFFSLMA